MAKGKKGKGKPPQGSDQPSTDEASSSQASSSQASSSQASSSQAEALPTPVPVEEEDGLGLLGPRKNKPRKKKSKTAAQPEGAPTQTPPEPASTPQVPSGSTAQPTQTSWGKPSSGPAPVHIQSTSGQGQQTFGQTPVQQTSGWGQPPPPGQYQPPPPGQQPTGWAQPQSRPQGPPQGFPHAPQQYRPPPPGQQPAGWAQPQSRLQGPPQGFPHAPQQYQPPPPGQQPTGWAQPQSRPQGPPQGFPHAPQQYQPPPPGQQPAGWAQPQSRPQGPPQGFPHAPQQYQPPPPGQQPAGWAQPQSRPQGPPQGFPHAPQQSSPALPPSQQQPIPDVSTLSLSERKIEQGQSHDNVGQGRGQQQARGQGRSQGQGRGRGQAQTQPTGTPMSTPEPRPSTQVQNVPSRAELTCIRKIPDKIIGRSVRSIPVKVLANYLPMTFKPIKVYRYDVSFKPDRPKKMLKDAYRKVIETHYRNEFIAFDQAKNIYCFQPLKNVPQGGRLDIKVELKDPNNKSITFEVSFKATGVVDLGRIKAHMESGGSSLNTPSEEIQCIDVILRQGALDSYVKCGRQFFKRPARPIDLSGGLEMWTGLFQSAIFTSHAFINVDVAHKGFPIHQSVIATMTNCFNLKPDSPIESQRSYEIENFKSFMKNLRVVARMVDGQTREFITNGIVAPPKELFFIVTNNNKDTKVSVFDYFTKEKGYRLRYPNLNCAWVGPREKNIYYPLEFLEVSYGQAVNKQLNERQLSTMVKEAATPPDIRKKKIEEVTRDMKYSQNPFFKKFGLEISDKFLEVDAKVLQPPTLDVGDGRPAMPRRGVWQAQKLQKPESLVTWGIVSVDCRIDHSVIENITKLVMDAGRQMGMSINPPKYLEYNKRMTELRNIMFKMVDNGVNFLFVVISGFSKDAYPKVKQMAEKDVGLLTQCIKDNTAQRRMNIQTMRNILLKVNSKLMGVNQVLDARSRPACLDKATMVVGADVTHPSPDQSNIPSIAAVTASIDPTCFKYNIEMSIQSPKKEMIVQFEDMMLDHFKIYYQTNKYLPKKIYVFRDGVSEGQFAEVMNSELIAIQKAYATLCQNAKPEILFLLVQKRHHTRFFLGANSANVEPGTVVDTHIVHPKELDFYLVSHQAIKGTARPTRYHAVCNDGRIPHDEVEQLTYYLCHLYSRCTRAVSYPSPTYYAHLACLRARSLTYGQTFDNSKLERQPQRLKVLEKMLQLSRMFFV